MGGGRLDADQEEKRQTDGQTNGQVVSEDRQWAVTLLFVMSILLLVHSSRWPVAK